MDEFEIAMKQASQLVLEVRLKRCPVDISLKSMSNHQELSKKRKIEKSPQRYQYQSDSCGSDSEDDANQFKNSTLSSPSLSSLSRRVSSYCPSEEDRRRKQESLERCKSNLCKKKTSPKNSPISTLRAKCKKVINDYEYVKLGVRKQTCRKSTGPIAGKITPVENSSPILGVTQKKSETLNQNTSSNAASSTSELKLSEAICSEESPANKLSSSNHPLQRDITCTSTSKSVDVLSSSPSEVIRSKESPANNLSCQNSLQRDITRTTPKSNQTPVDHSSSSLPLLQEKITMRGNETPTNNFSSSSPPLPYKGIVNEEKVKPISDIKVEFNIPNSGRINETTDEVLANAKYLSKLVNTSITVIPVSKIGKQSKDNLVASIDEMEKVTKSAITPAPKKSLLRVKTLSELNAVVSTAVPVPTAVPVSTAVPVPTAAPVPTATIAAIAPFNINNTPTSELFMNEVNTMRQYLEDMVSQYYRFQFSTRIRKKTFLKTTMSNFCEIFKSILVRSNGDNKLGEQILLQVIEGVKWNCMEEPLTTDMYNLVPDMRSVFPKSCVHRVLAKIASQDELACQEKASSGNSQKLMGKPPPASSTRNSPRRMNTHQPSACKNVEKSQTRAMVPQVADLATQFQPMVSQGANLATQFQPMVSQAVNLATQFQPMVSQAVNSTTQFHPMLSSQNANSTTQFHPMLSSQNANLTTPFQQLIVPQTSQLSTQSESMMPVASNMTFRSQSMTSNVTEHRIYSSFHYGTNVGSYGVSANVENVLSSNYPRPTNVTHNPSYFPMSTSMAHAASLEFPMPSNAMHLSSSNLGMSTNVSNNTSSSFLMPGTVDNTSLANTTQWSSSKDMEKLDWRENIFSETQELLRDFYLNMRDDL